jgi:hypothetical protein
MNIRAEEIARIAESLQAICGDDEKLFTDMMEGETDLHWLVNQLHDRIATDAGMVNGIKHRKADLDERQSRLAARIEAHRVAIIQLMQAGKVAKLELPEATYSIREGKPRLVINDEAVPRKYQREKLETDKAKINEVFADASDLPNWMTREPAKPILTARVK